MKQIKLTGEAKNSYKIGMNEIVGLEKAMRVAFKPVEKFILDKAYWVTDIVENAEYKSRDGFIPHSHNYGGLQIRLVIPKCEQYDFDFIDFGECDDTKCDHDHHCAYEDNGDLDGFMEIWFKFEGIDNGKLKFYIVLSGSNQDAPYFRIKYQPTLFETEFSCKSVSEIKEKSKKSIQKLLKAMGAK